MSNYETGMEQHGHPTPGALLLFVEEPEVSSSNDVKAHLEGCPECRRRLEQLMQAGEEFQQTVLACSPVLDAPPEYAVIARAWSQSSETSSPQTSRFRSWWSAPRMVASASLATALGIALFLLLFDRPAPMQAAEFLSRVSRQFKQSRQSHDVARVTPVQIRVGKSQYRAIGTSRPHDPRIQQAFQLARVRWEDPLNPDDFASWRQQAGTKRDEVTTTKTWIRLTTTVLGESAVRSASITVDARDLHPIQRTVEYRDLDPIQISELPPSLTAPGPRQAEPRTASPELSGSTSSTSAADQQQAGADLAEVELWETLHRLGSDVRDGGSVRTDGHGVCYEVWPDGERSGPVLSALAPIPNTHRCEGGSTSSRTPSTRTLGTGNKGGTAPLAARIAERVGSPAEVSAYQDRVLREYLQALSSTSALHRLLQRFSPHRLAGLPAPLRSRLTAVAESQAATIHRDIGTYVGTLDLVLAPNQTTEPAPPPGAAHGCPVFSQDSTLIDDLRSLQHAFSAATSGDSREPDIPMATTDDALRRVNRSRNTLIDRVRGLCTDSP